MRRATVSRSPSSARATWITVRETPARQLLRELWDAVTANRLLVFASAIAFRGLVALVPLVLLGLALLGALGLQDTWDHSIRPAVAHHVQKPVASAIDYSVKQIFAGDSTSLIVFATAWVLWNMALAVSVVMQALNDIHDVDESRSLLRRMVTATALGAAAGALLVSSLLVLSAAPLIGGGWLHAAFGLGRWLCAPALLAAAVWLLFRYAPAERPESEWASAGSVLVIVVWLIISAAFVSWVSVANYKSATGNLAVLVTITLYVFASAATFLFGAQLDELLRKKAGRTRARRAA
jgi:membrane protein